MNELLKKDFTMKAVSVLIAVILWFMVLDQSNPYETRTLIIPLNIQNVETLKDKNILLKNQNSFPKTVEVALSGRHDKISSINDNDFEAILDLSKISDSKMKVLNIVGPTYKGKGSIGDITFNMDPGSVDLELDSVGNNVFRVETKTGGNLKDKYSIVSIVSSPDTIELHDKDSLLKTVGSIKAIIDVTNLDKDLETKQKITIFDKNNKDITKSFAEKLTVDLKITVAKEVGVKPVISGTPAPNFLNVSNISSPQKVLITGPHDLVMKIDQLLTAPISIENQNQNAIITSGLILPEGVTLVNSPEEVTVSLAIEPLARKSFVISRGDISIVNPEIDNSLKYDILTENLTVEIKGPKYELDKLNLARIAPSIDVSKLVEGNFKVTLKLALPNTVRLIQDYDVELSVVKR